MAHKGLQDLQERIQLLKSGKAKPPRSEGVSSPLTYSVYVDTYEPQVDTQGERLDSLLLDD